MEASNKKIYTRIYNGVALTEKQYQVMMFIIDYRARNGIGPAVRDFMRHFGTSGPNAVLSHLLALETRGLIEWPRGRMRMIRPAGCVTIDVPVNLVAEVRAFIAEKTGARP